MLPENYFLDHVAIAVSDLEKSVKIFEDLGLTFAPKREIVESEKVQTAFASIDSRAHLELLHPTSTESAISKFIEKKGEGIHHLAFRVPNIEEMMKELKDKGYKLLYETPKAGANNAKINFIHPKSTGGVLIEISEK